MPKCNSIGCIKPAIFGIDKAITCKEHKLVSYIDIRRKRCISCPKTPTYNLKGVSPKYCADHKTADMINVLTKRCLKCDKVPSYGLVYGRQATLCKDHAEPNMIDVVSKRCITDGCITRPTYQFPGKKVTKCFIHKLDGMISKSKKCQHTDCNIFPIYNKPGEKIGIYCASHKLDNMIDVVSKRCEKCNKIPSFNIRGQSAKFCADHKTSDMICVTIKKQCVSCDKSAYYNIKGEKALYCFDHKLDTMIRVNCKLCKLCDQRARYGIAGYPPDYCSKHKLLNYTRNSSSKKIEKLHCNVCESVINHDQTMCTICNNIIKNEVTQITLRKELVVKNMLTENGIIFKHDRSIEKAKESKRRPDFLMRNIHNNVIILEVDEFKHRHINKHSCDCEITRMKEIYMAHEEPDIKILFIRYNPDSFVGTNITPLNRLKYLLGYIKEQLKAKQVNALASVYLFYDNFDITKPEIQFIDPYEVKPNIAK